MTEPFSLTLTLDEHDFGALLTAITTTAEDANNRIVALEGKTDSASVESVQIYDSLKTALANLYSKLWNSPSQGAPK